MTKNKLKNTIEFIGLSYKKEMTKLVLINALFLLTALLSFVLLKNIIAPILVVTGAFILTYFFLSRYNDKKKNLLKNRENELISLISYFDVYVRNNNNVYQCFNLLIPYCSNWMKEKIEELLSEIDKDKSVQPFVDFANNFTSISIHSLMLSIYQMVDQGESSEQLTHFNLLFDEISKNRNNEMIAQKQKSLSNMSTFPLAGAGLITISLTISILTILGDLINVI